MDTKEKLVELLGITPCPNAICNYCEHFKSSYACKKHKKEVIAERLIAHGVAVQEWISVSERLPEENGPLGTSYSLVQVFLSDGSVTTGWCSRGHKMWYYLPYGGTHFIGQEYENAPVVAWQPMSEPPKERLS